MKKSAAPKMRWVAKDASKEAPPIQNASTENKGKAAKGKGGYHGATYDDSGGAGDPPRKRGPAKGKGKGGGEKGLAKGAGKGKGMSAKVPGAKTMQEVEAEMIKPKGSPSRNRGQETTSKRPMDATGTHCVVHKHSGMGCAVISLDSKSARDAILAYAERQSPSVRKKGAVAELQIEGHTVEIRPHVDKNSHQDVETDIFAGWGHQTERHSVLEAESIAEAFDDLLKKAQEESSNRNTAPGQPPQGGYISQPGWTGGQCGSGGVVMQTAGGTMPPAPMGAPPRPVIQGQFPQSGLAQPGMVAGGLQQQAPMYRPVVAQPMAMDMSQAYGYWMQQQQQQYAQQMAISSPSPAAMQMGTDPQQTQQQAVAAAPGYMSSYDAAWQAASGQASQAEMTRPLPKPMKIVDPNNGHALETREMNFKPREPRRPLPIIDPKSGESIIQQSGDGSSS